MIVVYNICGIKKRENVNYYITAIEAILSQENVEFQHRGLADTLVSIQSSYQGSKVRLLSSASALYQ